MRYLGSLLSALGPEASFGHNQEVPVISLILSLFVCLFVFNRVQFIIPAGPRQSLLLAKDPDQFLRKHYIP